MAAIILMDDSIRDWVLYDNLPARKLLFHLLSLCSVEPVSSLPLKGKPLTLSPGQCLVHHSELADATGLSLGVIGGRMRLMDELGAITRVKHGRGWIIQIEGVVIHEDLGLIGWKDSVPVKKKSDFEILAEEAERQKKVQRSEKDLDLDCSSLQKIWNDHASKHKQLSTVLTMTKARRDKIKVRVKENPKFVEIVLKALQDIPIPNREDFDWQPTFDWIVRNETNAISVCEGKFRRVNGKKKTAVEALREKC